MWSTQGEKKNNMRGGSLALTHLSALELSYLSSQTSFYLFFSSLHLSLLHSPPLSLTPRSHSSLLHFHFWFWLLGFLPPSFLSLDIFIYVSSLSCQKNSSNISQVHVSFIFRCWLIYCLSVFTSCNPCVLAEVREKCTLMALWIITSLQVFLFFCLYKDIVQWIHTSRVICLFL